MKRIHIIGGKNHGKTTLVVELVEELSARGIRVGTIKHTHHHHELDAPGKDSHRHREAGAAAVGILTRSMNAVFWPSESSGNASRDTSSPDDRYKVFEEMFSKKGFSDCELLLVEGDTQTTVAKVEVWRESLGSQPLAVKDTSIVAVVSHDKIPNLAVPLWPRADIAALADKILALVKVT